MQFEVSQKCIEIYGVVLIDRLKRRRFLSVAMLCHKVAKSVYSKETRNLIKKEGKAKLVIAFALYLCFIAMSDYILLKDCYDVFFFYR